MCRYAKHQLILIKLRFCRCYNYNNEWNNRRLLSCSIIYIRTGRRGVANFSNHETIWLNWRSNYKQTGPKPARQGWTIKPVFPVVLPDLDRVYPVLLLYVWICIWRSYYEFIRYVLLSYTFYKCVEENELFSYKIEA